MLVCAHCMAERKQAAMMDIVGEDPPAPLQGTWEKQPVVLFNGQTWCWRHLPVTPPMTDMEKAATNDIQVLFGRLFGPHQP